MVHYDIAKMDVQYDLTSDQVAGKEIVLVKGRGAANLQLPSQRRDFDWIAHTHFPALREQGLMEFGEGSKYDERKPRLDSIKIEENRIIISVGLTSYAAVDADIKRGETANIALQEMGKKQHNDPWAYFSRTLGVAVVPITTDGVVFAGERISDLYTGWINAAAGFVPFNENPSYEHFETTALQKLLEEFGDGVQSRRDQLRFVGIASNSNHSDADMVWLAPLGVSSEYFRSERWKERRTRPDHAPNLIEITTLAERDELLHGSHKGKKIPGVMYSTHLGLASLTEKDFQ